MRTEFLSVTAAFFGCFNIFISRYCNVVSEEQLLNKKNIGINILNWGSSIFMILQMPIMTNVYPVEKI